MARRRAVEEIAAIGFMMVVVAAIENPIGGTEGIEAQIVVAGSAVVARPPVVEKLRCARHAHLTGRSEENKPW
jgi:hypothetical protein